MKKEHVLYVAHYFELGASTYAYEDVDQEVFDHYSMADIL